MSYYWEPRGDQSREAGRPLRAADSQASLSFSLQPADAGAQSQVHDLSEVPSLLAVPLLRAGPLLPRTRGRKQPPPPRCCMDTVLSSLEADLRPETDTLRVQSHGLNFHQHFVCKT